MYADGKWFAKGPLDGSSHNSNLYSKSTPVIEIPQTYPEEDMDRLEAKNGSSEAIRMFGMGKGTGQVNKIKAQPMVSKNAPGWICQQRLLTIQKRVTIDCYILQCDFQREYRPL